MIDRFKRRYQPELLPGEQIIVVRNATAGGTGSKIAYGGIIGALAGVLIAISINTSALGGFVLGAFAGEIAGYFVANREARAPSGPGSIHLSVVLTSLRLLTLPRYGATRVKILRSYSRSDITASTTRRYPLGQLHRVELTMSDGAAIALITEGALEIPVNLDPANG